MNTSNNRFRDFRNQRSTEKENRYEYPIESFPDEIQQLILEMKEKLDTPVSFTGSTILTAFSTAIGSSMYVKTALGKTHLSLWTCLVGISSSGKSIASNELFQPFYEIQNDLDNEREESELRMNENDRERAKFKQVMYSDGSVPTLIKELLKPNPKGILFDTDEILIWINGLNSYGKNDTGGDEQIWIKIWDNRTLRKVLGGNKIFKVNKPFVNIYGGIQPALLYRLYDKGKDYSGFSYRILFAYPEQNKIALPKLDVPIDQSLIREYSDLIKRLYNELEDDESIEIQLSANAFDLYDSWIKDKTIEKNNLKNQFELEHSAGIFGKMKIYALRIAGILAVIERGYASNEVKAEIKIDAEVMMKAIKLADYYQGTAMQSLIAARQKQLAPPVVKQLATLHNKGLNFQEIGDKLYSHLKGDTRRQRARREFYKYSEMYPAIFGLKNT
ncbi:DUF3987 domain-containing protein [Marivirga tractuosa]|uniref:DUF3987 domain-containing protein n=1 Tax=Marivirga tractuosa TaxID=1006 RepID=UPI0035CFB1E4